MLFLARRVIFQLIVLLSITFFVFLLAQVAPADPARAALGPYATEESVELYRVVRGLDRPVFVQYFIYLRYLIRGDLGTSIVSGRPVTSELRTALPATVELVLPSLFISTIFGVLLGLIGPPYVNRWPDHLSRFLSVFGMAMPAFWLGVALQVIFFGRLGWLPLSGRLPIDATSLPEITRLVTVDALLAGRLDLFFAGLKHLPAITLSLVNIATLARITRSSLLDVLSQPYISVARSKGLPELRVLLRHAFPNVLIVLLTVTGLMIGQTLAGTVVVEFIFNWPGLGRQVVQAMIQLDKPIVLAFALLMGAVYGVTNILLDVSYGFVDPRVRR